MTVEGEKEKNKENQKYMKRRKGEQLVCKFLSFSWSVRIILVYNYLKRKFPLEITNIHESKSGQKSENYLIREEGKNKVGKLWSRENKTSQQQKIRVSVWSFCGHLFWNTPIIFRCPSYRTRLGRTLWPSSWLRGVACDGCWLVVGVSPLSWEHLVVSAVASRVPFSLLTWWLAVFKMVATLSASILA